MEDVVWGMAFGIVFGCVASVAFFGCTVEIKPDVHVNLCIENVNGKIMTVECDAGSTLQETP